MTTESFEAVRRQILDAEIEALCHELKDQRLEILKEATARKRAEAKHEEEKLQMQEWYQGGDQKTGMRSGSGPPTYAAAP